jgi:hypothetical protein
MKVYALNSKAYNDGFDTGISWNGSWMPGGPWYFTAHDWENEETKQRAKEMQLARLQWQLGFKDGLQARITFYPKFAKWWKENAGKSPIRVYSES